ncbi:formate--tetrahydrofolate ligase [Propionimicrobium sp. BV2F7]|uniref:formate--tetrahydrofolate ligase n=1 Tax=Propionimicrobium sp. BV2F7 TaxID=1111131 RepID=UPI0003D79A17|nr:formate--tetrahydrofolate ligase [Propionimicrobium sp. BV2F7]ETJ96696.1 formate--tetrahydrofolate ligase [Propionimicrobium sp. BV2F7]
MASDLEIAQSAKLRPLAEIGEQLSLSPTDLEPFGHYAAKIEPAKLREAGSQRGKYVVVTAVTPTPLGEGKTTTAIGLVQGLGKLGKKVVATLRQPSLGPVFGIKGGAAGAGYSQVVPMETLNLHLTGDFHAITAAHNLLAAMVDNHLQHGNKLDIEPHSITWGRVLDMNDRALRNIVVGLGRKVDGVPRQSRFDITAASEIMTIVAQSADLPDLRARLGRIVVGFNTSGEPVTAEDLKAAGAMAVLLRDALRPNLLQTLEGQAALIHCGPFGNIATGNSSIIADKFALANTDFVVTEAGFGADLGYERFVNVKCATSGLVPDAAVIVVTVRALKLHSGRHKVVAGKPLPPELLEENSADVEAGLSNLAHHLDIVRKSGVPAVVAINAFPDDHESEHQVIKDFAASKGVACVVSTHVADGGEGAQELAKAVVEAADQATDLHFSYEPEDALEDKINSIATKVYGADGVKIEPAAAKQLARFTELGFGKLPVLIAKTHLSTTADPADRGAPTGWTLPIREVRLAAGAGYVYALAGAMQTMPGLGTHPAAEKMDITPDGRIVGLF